MQRLWIAMPPSDLHVEMALADRPLGRLADQGERLGQQAVERIALLGPEPELVGDLPSAPSSDRLELRLQSR